MLNDKEKKIMQFIQEYSINNGYAPSVREIGRGTHFRSTSTIHRYLKALEDKGYIHRGFKTSRTIQILRAV